MLDDLAAMRRALALAEIARSAGEVPVGAVIIAEGVVLAEAFNQREALADPTAHAERLALTLAGRVRGSWRLTGCSLFVTLEPCPMCAGALVLARIDRVVYGASDPKAGACRSLYRLLDDPRLNHRVTVQAGLLERECSRILAEFFLDRRTSRQRGVSES